MTACLSSGLSNYTIMFPHPVPATQYKKKILFKVNSYKSKPTHTDVKWDRSQIYGLVSHGFSDTPGIIEDGINSTQILVKEFRGAAWTLYSLEAGLFFFFFLLPEAGSTSTEPIRNHKPESKPVIKNFLCPPEHTISGVHDRVRHKTNMWKERSPLAHGIRQSSPSGWEGCNRSIVLGAYGTDSVVDQEVEKARPKWEWGYLSNAFSQRQPSTSFSPPPEGLPVIQSSTTSWE